MRCHNVSDKAAGSVRWRRSSRSYATGNCVEIAAPDGERVIVRDSKNANGAVLTFSPIQWNSFVASMGGGSEVLYGIKGCPLSAGVMRIDSANRSAEPT
jgi:hypothetical protein